MLSCFPCFRFLAKFRLALKCRFQDCTAPSMTGRRYNLKRLVCDPDGLRPYVALFFGAHGHCAMPCSRTARLSRFHWVGSTCEKHRKEIKAKFILDGPLRGTACTGMIVRNGCADTRPRPNTGDYWQVNGVPVDLADFSRPALVRL